MKRSTFIAASLAVLALPFTALAQTDWPQKPVTMVVPYPPGGVNDAVPQPADFADISVRIRAGFFHFASLIDIANGLIEYFLELRFIRKSFQNSPLTI